MPDPTAEVMHEWCATAVSRRAAADGGASSEFHRRLGEPNHGSRGHDFKFGRALRGAGD
jgi:hypothetical protein